MSAGFAAMERKEETDLCTTGVSRQEPQPPDDGSAVRRRVQEVADRVEEGHGRKDRIEWTTERLVVDEEVIRSSGTRKTL
jgi:hypothetical protein|uniref:Uncharacterized protein n=2 Tax=Oryza TaxID=4527 RepID=Q6ZLC5_ORYSJ|nr:hypothetical protein [Oryza sativa Japonica Group]